jgi:hypothetical protein
VVFVDGSALVLASALSVSPIIVMENSFCPIGSPKLTYVNIST